MILKILKIIILLVFIGLIVEKVQGEWGNWGPCETQPGASPYSSCGSQRKLWESPNDRKMPEKDKKCQQSFIDYINKKDERFGRQDQCDGAIRFRPCHKPWNNNEWVGYTEDPDPTFIQTMTFFLFAEKKIKKNRIEAFYQAQQKCVGFGAQIASITSEKEYNLIKKKIVELDPEQKKCWQLGLIRLDGYPKYGDVSHEHNGWHWLDGSPKSWKITWHRRGDDFYNEPNDGIQEKGIPWESEGCIKVPKEHADKGDVYDFLTSYERHHVPYICKKVCTLMDKPHANYGTNRG